MGDKFLTGDHHKAAVCSHDIASCVTALREIHPSIIRHELTLLRESNKRLAELIMAASEGELT